MGHYFLYIQYIYDIADVVKIILTNALNRSSANLLLNYKQYYNYMQYTISYMSTMSITIGKYIYRYSA